MAIEINGAGTITGLNADGISAQPVFPGNVLQVVSTTKTDTFSASVGAGAISGDVTGLTATITPISTSSKILIFCNIAGAAAGTNAIGPTLYRGGSLLTAAAGDSAGSRSRVTSCARDASDGVLPATMFSFLDSPNSTSAFTYSIRLRHSSTVTQTVFVNRSVTDTDAAQFFRSMSSITLMEIAG